MPSVDLGKVVGDAGVGVPTGGSAGQVLRKNSASNYDTEWDTVPDTASIGIVENGTNAAHTISQGQYVIWQGLLYMATVAIPSGTTLGSSNLASVTNGGFNALNSIIQTRNASATVTVGANATADVTFEIPLAFTNNPQTYVLTNVSSTTILPLAVRSWSDSTHVSVRIYNCGSAASNVSYTFRIVGLATINNI